MKWKDIASTLGKVAPTLGTLLGGPTGASVGVLISNLLGVENTPTAVEQALKANPELLIKLKELDVKLAEIDSEEYKAELELQKSSLSDVNKTMQAESSSDHWPTYTWRPSIGFAVAFNIIISSVLALIAYCAALGGHPEGLTQLPMVIGALTAINATAMPVLGIASYFRGKAQADPNVTIDTKG